MAKKNMYVHLDMNQNQLLNISIHQAATAPTTPVEGQLYYNTSNKKYWGWDGTTWLDLSQVVSGSVTLKGEITNANTNPAAPSSPTTGDMWFITTTSGTVGGLVVEVGDQLIRSTTGWFVMQKNLDAATESTPGYISIATQSETNAGSNDSKAITPLKLVQFLINGVYAKATRTLITTLTANTPTTVTHGLALTHAEKLSVTCYQAGDEITLRVSPSTINAVIVESNNTLSNVTVSCIGG